MASKADMTPEEREAKEQEEFSTGPLRVLTDSVKNNTQVLINCRWRKSLFVHFAFKFSCTRTPVTSAHCRNNKKLLGRVKAFDRYVSCQLYIWSLSGPIEETWSRSSTGLRLSDFAQISEFFSVLDNRILADNLSHLPEVSIWIRKGQIYSFPLWWNTKTFETVNSFHEME